VKPDIYDVSTLLDFTGDTAGVLCEVIANTERKGRPQSHYVLFSHCLRYFDVYEASVLVDFKPVARARTNLKSVSCVKRENIYFLYWDFRYLLKYLRIWHLNTFNERTHLKCYALRISSNISVLSHALPSSNRPVTVLAFIPGRCKCEDIITEFRTWSEWGTSPGNLSVDFSNILHFWMVSRYSWTPMFISVGFPDNSISVGMVQGHVYFCRYFSLTRGFLSLFFSDICIFYNSDSESLYSCRGFSRHMHFCRYCFWTSILLSVKLNILHICQYCSRTPLLLSVVIPNTLYVYWYYYRTPVSVG